MHLSGEKGKKEKHIWEEISKSYPDHRWVTVALRWGSFHKDLSTKDLFHSV